MVVDIYDVVDGSGNVLVIVIGIIDLINFIS